MLACCNKHIFVQSTVPMVTSDCKVEPLTVRVDWRSAITKSGVQSAMISGMSLMLEWPVSNLGSPELVSPVAHDNYVTQFVCSQRYNYENNIIQLAMYGQLYWSGISCSLVQFFL